MPPYKPQIGLSCELKPPDSRRSFSRKKDILVLNRDYSQAVEKAGGLPCPLPIFDEGASLTEFVALLDGVILTGGSDVIEADRTELVSRTCLQRSRHETALIEAALGINLPLLGICRGLQQINVYFGGTLWDDLPAWKAGAIDHQHGKRSRSFRHKIKVTPGTQLQGLLGAPNLEVNSYHHQAAKEVGKNLRITALAEDGVIEALEGSEPDRIWAVQWHPERLGEHPAGSGLLRQFVDLCSARKEKR